MNAFKVFSATICRRWDWLRRNKEWVFSGISIVVLLGVLISVFMVGSSITVQNNDQAVAEAIKALNRELERKEQDLADAWKRELAAQYREQPLQVDLAALEETIAAIPKQTEIPDAQARIEETLAAVAEGNTALAEAIFSEVEAREVSEGKAVYRKAAEAARHNGAIAFLHDTDKAIAAYRRVTELDPENADDWNQLGRLLDRTGKLDAAETAYRKVESLGRARDDQVLLATAYGAWVFFTRLVEIWTRPRPCFARA